MSQFDLTPQAVLQQSSAHPISGDVLETYGKHAADLYAEGACDTLDSAVVETIKSAGLSPEQVRRVVEFTNTQAFITEFKKEGTANKYVTFEGGPASFNNIIQDLNDGGGGTVFDRGTLDYSHVPDTGSKTASARGMDKTASAEDYDDIAQMFAVDVQAPPIPYANPMQDVQDLRSKLATVRDHWTSEMSSLEVDLLSVTDEMVHQVKQAALDGVSLGSVVQAWDQALSPEPALVKAAFAVLGERLRGDVFRDQEELNASIEKTAGVGLVVVADHPIVSSFDAYCSLVTKLAHMREARAEAVDGYKKLLNFELSVAKNYSEVSQ